MPNLRFTTLLAAAALTLTAQARLFESVKECDDRYGEGRDLELKLGDDFKNDAAEKWTAKVYSAQNLIIQVIFEDKIAALVRYANEPPLKLADSTARPVILTADEISYLRGINLNDSTSWKPYRDRTLKALSPSMTIWRSSDNQRFSGYDRDRRQLFVCSSSLWDVVAGNIQKRAETKAEERFEGL